MIFGWMQRRRRARLAAEPVSEERERAIRRYCRPDRFLSDANRRALRETVNVLVAEKRWEGCGGLESTEEIRSAIAAQAALLTLGRRDEAFDGVRTILIYPDTFVREGRTPIGDAAEIVEEQALHGEAHYRGPIVVAWSEVAAAADPDVDPGNVVVHEFAHQIDMRSGDADGFPPIGDRRQRERFAEATNRTFARLCRDVRRGRETTVDDAAVESKDELFAYGCEAFVCRPHRLRRTDPEYYDALVAFFGYCPAETFGPQFEAEYETPFGPS